MAQQVFGYTMERAIKEGFLKKYIRSEVDTMEGNCITCKKIGPYMSACGGCQSIIKIVKVVNGCHHSDCYINPTIIARLKHGLDVTEPEIMVANPVALKKPVVQYGYYLFNDDENPCPFYNENWRGTNLERIILTLVDNKWESLYPVDVIYLRMLASKSVMV